MTTKIGNTVVICAEPEDVCVRCKKKEECRDVLGNGEPVCFDCSTEDETDDYLKRLFDE
jgi:hypothetical protein